MTSDKPNDKSGSGNKQWQIWLAGVVLALIVGMMGVQWQAANDAAESNQKQTDKLEELHRADIARLDESNRNRRNQIADLEERIARVEERTGG